MTNPEPHSDDEKRPPRRANLYGDTPPADYDRPHRSWLCGLEEEGCPCSAGPTTSGRCPGAVECQPVRDGDRWLCNRSELRGGPCDGPEGDGEGPTPEGQCCLARHCKPKRSLRVRRGRWIGGAALLSLGAILLTLGSADRNEWIVPGTLTSHHAQVIARTAGTERCATCHPGANGDALTLVGDGVRGAGASEETQSMLCLKCHQNFSMPGAEPLLAHGLPTETLAPPKNHASPNEPLACAVCHQEHHGAKHDLTALTDARCQACHQEVFADFVSSPAESGHPDFGPWPYVRRTRITFNHASHEAFHFDKAERPFDCRECHGIDATGDLTARLDYNASCGECHEADLAKSFARGIPLLALPTLDDSALSEAGHALREWPAAAIGDFDGELPALLKLLLAADPQASEAFGQLGEDFSFFDINADDPQQVALAANVVDSLRNLLEELQEEGHANFDNRLRTLLGTTALPVSLADLVSRLPIELVDQLQAVWFRKESSPSFANFDAMEDRRTGGGWWLDGPSLSLRYRPAGHDDPFLRAWIDLIVALPEAQNELREACLAEFTRQGASGSCFTCHSLDRDALGVPVVHWSGRNRRSEPRGFTHFSHRPHLSQPELADCTHCHKIDPSADLKAVYVGGDPHRFRSEFLSLSKSACTDCHRPQAAGDHCTQCHNYHVSPQSAEGFTTEIAVGTEKN